MKKLLISLLAALLLLPCAKAQDDPRFGIEGGVNIAYISGFKEAYYEKTAPFCGLFLGGVAEFEFSEVIGAKLGLSIGQQGVLASLMADTSEWTMETCLNIPAHLTFEVIEDRLKLYFGPQLGFVLAAKDYDVVRIGKSYDRFITKWERSVINTVDLAVSVGAQVMLSESFGLNVRYNFGVIPIFKDIPKSCNMVGQIGAMWLFN